MFFGLSVLSTILLGGKWTIYHLSQLVMATISIGKYIQTVQCEKVIGSSLVVLPAAVNIYTYFFYEGGLSQYLVYIMSK